MYGMLISIAFLFPQAGQVQAAQPATQEAAKTATLDGNWTVVCYERDGQTVDAAKNATVTYKDNTLKFEAKDGTTKLKSMRVEFGKEGTLRVTEIDSVLSAEKSAGADPTKAGVYVLSKNYLAICLHDEVTGKDAAGAERTTASLPATKSQCTIFLKRADAANDR
jgi:uncharacterized protein (TIGR03067 family)